jgi:UDP-N-acetylglucosamine--N-acetylmuramyl-(pentapeptide) pyrophosphoryl-undecaprenol N-acetylglucosamine transferase
MRVILAGGGTGGHVIPALAIAQELRARYHADVLFVGTQRGIETRLVPAAGFKLHLIQVGALNRVDFATRLKTLLDLPRALMESAKLIREFRPDVMIGVGGYASGPAMLTAAMMSVPTVAFEPNVVPGFANRMLAPMVSAAAVHFEATCHYFRNCHVTGVPVRQEFFHVPARAAVHTAVHTKDARPTLLVFGGSQGASAINQAVLEALPKLMEAVPGIHVIHQTGERDYVTAQAVYLRTMISAEVSPFIDDMPGAFARADLLVCRSGASTVAEITAAGKPAIFVPLPTAAADHQTQNAATLADGGAARLLRQSEFSSDRVVSEIAELLRDRPRLAAMAEAARRFAHPDAAAKIADLAARAAGVQSRHAVA